MEAGKKGKGFDMCGKDFLIDFVRTYFMIVTLITVVMLVIGQAVMPDQTFGYSAFAAPLIYALVGTVPNLVLYSKRELKVKELIIRKVLQLLLIEAGILFIFLYDANENWKETRVILILAVSVFVVYMAGTLIAWAGNYLSAKSLTRELLEFQKMNQ